MNRYSDMLHLPHHVSPTRAKMSIHDRAAQFAPFAALTGYEAVIEEASRVTEAPVFLTDSAIEELDRVLQMVQAGQRVCVVYFQSDARKEGGAKCRTTGVFRKVDPHRQILLLEGGREVPLEDILEIQVFDKK